jgi:uncharacterized SAM-binding protein YcdF (DUF218 family)/glycosyltransferase involved in cell wall biosynthesis
MRDPAVAGEDSVLRDQDIVCIASIDWDFVWQGHQQVMSMLAAQGNRILFIENTGVRPPQLGDLGRLRHRISRWWNSTRGFRQEAPNLHVFSPLILPWPYSRVAGGINRIMLVRAIRRWMRVMKFRRPIVWTFLPTPLARALLSALEPEVSVYYCVDDLRSSSVPARKIQCTEEKVFAEVDLVFVTSEKLRARAARFAPRVHVFPFAVDYPPFEAARTDGLPLPANVAALTRPIVGYVGGVHRWVDQSLLAETARRLPQVTFTLVGPLQAAVEPLIGCPNLRFLGGCSHADVPRYLKAFDVALIPYRLTEYTASVYPTKLNEYLAMGLPVVATDLPEIRRFNAEHGNVVTVGGTTDEFVGGIREALEHPSPGDVARRIEVARSNSWEARVAEMSRLIEARLTERPRVEGAWEDRLEQMYRVTCARLTRAAAAAAVLVALYGALFWSPLPWIAAEPLRVTAAPAPADAIVVLGGGVGESGQGGQGYQERVKKAAELYRAGHAAALVFSTGWTYTFHEADLMRSLAVSLGVPETAIILEKKAASTYENARFVQAIAQPRGWNRILLVSSPYHMRRALLTFRKQAPELEVIPIPAASAFYVHKGMTGVSQLRALLHEYVGILDYWRRGWI